jgi:hypothetical protein
MTKRTTLRVLLALNAVVAGVALTIKFAVAATTADPRFTSVFGRIVNELCYFTIQSNLIVFGMCAALALWPERAWFARVPRLIGLVCITVTAVVYYGILAAAEHYVGVALIGDVLAHAVSPLLYVGTWLAIGPRGILRRHDAFRMLTFPIFWATLTLVRGAIIHVYPYDFIDVQSNGYLAVTITVAVMTAAAGVLAAGAVAVDRAVRERATRPFRTRRAHPAMVFAQPPRRTTADR